MSPQPPCAHHHGGLIRCGRGLRWHGPTHALRARVPPVVGAPSRSEGYGVVAPRPTPAARVPLWSRGIPGTRANARVAARCTSSTAF